MRDQTCGDLRSSEGIAWSSVRSASGLVKGWTPLRWGLVGTTVVLVGGLLFQSYWVHAVDPEEEVAESTAVLVADRYVPESTVVRPGMVQPRSFPKGFVPPGALHSVKELEAEGGIGRFAAAVAIPEGQPLTKALLSDLRAHHGMASTLPPGHVAIAFSVNAVRGAGGWIQPGDRVAIYAANDERASTKERAARLLFSSVSVLAVDHRRIGGPATGQNQEDPSAAESGETVLTVGLNPVEAERLLEAREQGHLSVLLRALGDDLPWPERLQERHG